MNIEAKLNATLCCYSPCMKFAVNDFPREATRSPMLESSDGSKVASHAFEGYAKQLYVGNIVILCLLHYCRDSNKRSARQITVEH